MECKEVLNCDRNRQKYFWSVVAFVMLLSGVANKALALEDTQWLEARGHQFPLSVSKNRKGPLLGRALILVPQLAGQRNSRSIQALAKLLPNDGWHTILVPVDAASKGEVSDKPVLEEAPDTPEAGGEAAPKPEPEDKQEAEADADSDAGAEVAARAKKTITIPVPLSLLDRIKTTLAGLPDTNASNTVIIAGREHALQVMGLIASQEIAAPTGLVTIDMTGNLEKELQTNFYSQMFPVLDIAASLGSKSIAKKRKYIAAENNHPDYRYISVPSPAPNWMAGRDRITQRVRGWLKQRWGDSS